jgi:hypothetical protein
MSLKSQFAWIAALMVVISVASVARAQQRVTVAHDSHVAVNPLIEPDRFGGPDFQFFAPADIDDYSGGDPPNVGFYLTVDKLYINVQRPHGNAYTFDALVTGRSVYPLAFQSTVNDASLNSGTFGDFTWGNRADFGYMTPEDIGWSGTIYHISGPNESLVQPRERPDRRNDNDPSDGLGGAAAGSSEPFILDRNPRFFDITQSLNNASFSSFELNRVWRKKQLHYGGVFEPYVGARYINFKDKTRRDSYVRMNTTTVGLAGTDVPTGADEPADPHDRGFWDLYNQNFAEINNYMFGGQLGFRLSKRVGHWNLSSDLKFFALQNFQQLTTKLVHIRTHYTHETPSENALLERREAFMNHAHAQEFVWGGEYRLEAEYALTRDVSMRGGFVMIDLGRGVGRGGDLAFNQQGVFMAGGTFGITINR